VPHLVFLTCGDTARVYAARERATFARELPGLRVTERVLPPSTSMAALLAAVLQLNDDASVQAVAIQLPLPPCLDAPAALAALAAEKDASGLSSLNYRELCLKVGLGAAPPPLLARSVAAACTEGRAPAGGRARACAGCASGEGPRGVASPRAASRIARSLARPPVRNGASRRRAAGRSRSRRWPPRSSSCSRAPPCRCAAGAPSCSAARRRSAARSRSCCSGRARP
jgi:hypothetical protein